MYGNDYNYAASRLGGTIVRVKGTGELVEVGNIDALGVATVHKVEKIGLYGGDWKEIKLDDLDVKPFRLGYVNFNAVAPYLERAPIRKGNNNQGLSARNCQVYGGRLKDIPIKAIMDSVEGRFPTIERAVQATKLRKGAVVGKTLAFHRYWAVHNGSILLYKRQVPVGSIYEDGRAVFLEEYSYLKEAFERCTSCIHQ